MAVERIRAAFEKSGSHRFTILFGSGIDDAFITNNRKEMNIEAALMRYLRQQGYQQVLFFSPHQAIYQIDGTTLRAIPAAGSPGGEPRTIKDNQMRYITGGPLGDRMVYKQAPESNHVREQGMGDMHAIRILDSYMKDESQPPTAIIWSQAESTINYFDDPRLLAGIFADWLRLPSSNSHTVLLVFSADSREVLQDIAQRLPIPEIRNHILRTEPGTQRGIHTIELGTPDLSEIVAMVSYAQALYQYKIHNQDVNRLTNWMAAENLRVRDWMVRLSEIQTFDLETARKQGWFSAHRSDPRSIEDRLNLLIGLDEIKDRLFEMAAWLMVNRKKQQQSAEPVKDYPLLHLVFTGNPGTGKTTVARLIGEIYHEIGILRRGHLIEARVSDLVADHVGGTAVKTNRVVDEALDGVLFIDEAYRLTEPERGGFGQEALDTLLTRMEDDRRRLVVIVAGYPDRIERFLNANPGLPRRFPVENRFHFNDYSSEELWQIMRTMLDQRDLTLSDGMVTYLKEVIEGLHQTRDATFGNAGEMRNLVDALERRRAARIVRLKLSIGEALVRDDIPEKYQEFIHTSQVSIEQMRVSLQEYAGWAPYKAYLSQIFSQEPSHTPHIVAAAGVKPVGYSHHLIFTGNAGTGKSQAGIVLGKVLTHMGLLRKGHVVEVTPDDLQRGGIGQSLHRVRETVRQALDGILMIDRAGTIFGSQNLSYTAQEIIDGINQAMQDYPQRLVVVVADTHEMLDLFVQSQARILGRFGAVINFPDFTSPELAQIVCQNLNKTGLETEPKALAKIERYLNVEAASEGLRFRQAKNSCRFADKIRERCNGQSTHQVLASHVPDVVLSVVVGASDAAQVEGYKKIPNRIIQQEWVLPELGEPMPESDPSQSGVDPEMKKTPKTHPRKRKMG